MRERFLIGLLLLLLMGGTTALPAQSGATANSDEADAATRATVRDARPFPYAFRFRPSPPEELRSRREALAFRMKDGVALFLSRERSDAVTTTRYRPDNNLYYLTGVETDPAALLVVARDGKLVREALFVPEESPSWALWNGYRTTAGPEAARLTGIENVVALSVPRMRRGHSWRAVEEALTEAIAAGATDIFLDHGGARRDRRRDDGLDLSTTTREDGIREWLSALEAGSTLSFKPASGMVGALRAVKSAYEIEMMQAAVDATGEAHVALMKNSRPGMWEFEYLGIATGIFYECGATGTAYPPICAAGPNSCVLHYDTSRRQTKDGDIILCDIGAEFGYYAADITRSFPVNGRFSADQKRVYEAVLKAQEAAAAALKPGATLDQLHRIAVKTIDQAGFEAHEVFPHFVSHHIGLDVHDPGSMGRLVPGMVITIEPGIYLADQELGIRIEDMFLVTPEGSRCLSAAIPKTIEEIEALTGSAHETAAPTSR